jgi:hypothetical protein
LHPILANRSAALWYAVLWAAAGLFLAFAISRATGTPLLPAVAWVPPMVLMFGFIALSAWYLCRFAPLRDAEPLGILAVHGAGAIISSALWIGMGYGWAMLIEKQVPGTIEVAGTHPAPRFLFAVLAFLLSSAAHYVYITLEESRSAEKRALTMQMLATDAELRALRSQITPHFLFNALNSINALTSSDAAGARRMCLLLSDFLRGTLQLSTQERIPLAQELSLIDQFLAIEQVRFGERLQVERHIAPEAAGWPILPLLLQPLVENAITHGIADVLDSGTLRLEAVAVDGRLTLIVENPRDPAGRRRAGAGMGLVNVRRRLETAYGREASMQVDVSYTRYRVAVTLPAPAPAGLAGHGVPAAAAPTAAAAVAAATATAAATAATASADTTVTGGAAAAPGAALPAAAAASVGGPVPATRPAAAVVREAREGRSREGSI